MISIEAKGINDAWLQLLDKLDTEGARIAPRGLESIEALNVSVNIKNPKKRLLTLPIRRISLPFAYGELIWYLQGKNDLETMVYYSRAMARFSDDGETLNSAYGHRIFGHNESIGFNQWEHVVNQLKQDPGTRQAIIHLHTPNNKPTKDEVCTLTLQFFIRDGKLDMSVNMRSNDVVMGFTYDVFTFTSIQELIANELNVEMGEYNHKAGSMHIYEKDFHFIDKYKANENALHYMTKYDTEFDYQGVTIHDKDFERLYINEGYLRNGLVHKVLKTPTNSTLQSMSDILELYSFYKRHGKLILIDILEHDNLYHVMMRNYIFGIGVKEIPKLTIVEGSDGAGKTTFIKTLKESFVSEEPVQVLNYKKPTPDFDKLIYFHTAFSSYPLILDRFVYSEFVYSSVFGRDSSLSPRDLYEIESILVRREADVVWLDSSPEDCFSRLDTDDLKVFNRDDISNICSEYKRMFGGSLAAIHGRLIKLRS